MPDDPKQAPERCPRKGCHSTARETMTGTFGIGGCSPYDADPWHSSARVAQPSVDVNDDINCTTMRTNEIPFRGEPSTPTREHGVPADQAQGDERAADQWMRENKGILPGPLSESDWDQIVKLLAAYAARVPSPVAGETPMSNSITTPIKARKPGEAGKHFRKIATPVERVDIGDPDSEPAEPSSAEPTLISLVDALLECYSDCACESDAYTVPKSIVKGFEKVWPAPSKGATPTREHGVPADQICQRCHAETNQAMGCGQLGPGGEPNGATPHQCKFPEEATPDTLTTRQLVNRDFAAQAAATLERAEFERQAVLMGFDVDGWDGEGYPTDIETDAMWRGWQARAALAGKGKK